MASHQEPDFGELIAALSRQLASRHIGFMLIGGQAVLLHGAPRLTEDIDVTLGVGPEALATLLAACLTLGLDPLPEDVDAFVRDTFVLPLRDRARSTGCARRYSGTSVVMSLFSSAPAPPAGPRSPAS